MSSDSPSPSPSSTPLIPLPSTIEEKLAFAARLKEEGNQFFKSGDATKAISKYTKIFAYVHGLKSPPLGMERMLPASQQHSEPSEDHGKTIDALLFQANNNLSACYFKLKDGKKTIQYASKALELDGNNAKALFRKGMGYSLLGDLDSALEWVEQASKAAPEDSGIRSELSNLKKKVNEKEAVMRKKFAEKFAQGGLGGKKKEKIVNESVDTNVNGEKKNDGGEDGLVKDQKVNQ